MKIIDNSLITNPVKLGSLQEGQVFKFVDGEEYGSMYHMVIQDRIVELEDVYASWPRSSFDHDYVVVYDATLQVSR